MELLRPPKAAIGNFLELESKLAIERFNASLGSAPDDFLQTAREVLVATILASKDPDRYAAAREKWYALRELSDWKSVDDKIYYAIRGGRCWALDFPYNYMDVFPYVSQTDTMQFIARIKGRNRLAVQHGIQHYIIMNDILRSPRALAEGINRKTARILAGLPVGGRRLTIHFDGRRIIRRVSLPRGHIHMFNIMYDIGWQDYKVSTVRDWFDLGQFTSKPIGDSPEETRIRDEFTAIHMNYMIARDIVFDILHHVIRDSPGDLDVWISEDRLDSISYLFVRLGNAICQRQLQIVFEDNYETLAEWNAMAATKYIISYKGAEPIPVCDIAAVQAVYLLHHEMYYANHPSDKIVPSYPLESQVIMRGENWLYRELLRLFKQYHWRWLTMPIVDEDDSQIHNIANQLTSQWAELPEGNELVVLIGLPGSGKSTFTDSKSEYAVINMDDIMKLAVIDGKTLEEKTREKYAEISAACMALPGSRLQQVVATTLKYECRRAFVSPYKKIARLVEDRLFEYQRKPKVIYETVGFNIYRTYFNGGHVTDDCQLADGEPSLDLFQQASSIRIIYNSLEKLYCQQLGRSITEGRITRWYGESTYYYWLWNTRIPPEYHSKITVVTSGDSRYDVALVAGGRIDTVQLAEYEATYGQLPPEVSRFIWQFSVSQ